MELLLLALTEAPVIGLTPLPLSEDVSSSAELEGNGKC